jgi:hypothetical protein
MHSVSVVNSQHQRSSPDAQPVGHREDLLGRFCWPPAAPHLVAPKRRTSKLIRATYLYIGVILSNCSPWLPDWPLMFEAIYFIPHLWNGTPSFALTCNLATTHASRRQTAFTICHFVPELLCLACNLIAIAIAGGDLVGDFLVSNYLLW